MDGRDSQADMAYLQHHHNHSRTLSSSHPSHSLSHSHSNSSSLADVDYYDHVYSHSRSSSQYDDNEHDHGQYHDPSSSSSSSSPEYTSRPPSQANHNPSTATFQPPQRRSSIKNRQTSAGSAHPPALRSASSASSLSGSNVPSFSAFRQQAPSVPPSSSPSATWGKLGRTAPLHTTSYSLSTATQGSPRVVSPPTKRSISLDSRLPQPSSGTVNTSLPPVAEVPSPRPSPRPDAIPYVFPSSGSVHDRTASIDSRITGDDVLSSSIYNSPRNSNIPIHKRYVSEESLSHAPNHSAPVITSSAPSRRTSQTASAAGQRTAQGMAPHFDSPVRTLSNESLGVGDPSEPPRPKSPGARIGNFFGWKATPSPSGKSHSVSPSTNFSDRSMSPLPSPQVDKPLPPVEPASPDRSPSHLVIPEKKPSMDYFDHPDAPVLAGSPENITHVKELERELAQVSAELAASIRREMDLEDDLDRMRTEFPSMAPLSESGRRGSDYFSDSGTSSVRFPITDYDSKLEQLEKSLRKVEQEKANLKLEMASRLQTELSRRRDLEQMAQTYEMQLKQSIDHHGERSDIEHRVEELESILEDTRRLLNQERQAKGSVEDLYSASREQLERHKNESDNLRDEVVPALKARVEGLESEAAEKEALTYENARMQQELTSLQERLGGRYGAIAEEEGGAGQRLARSGTHGKRGGSLTRSGSLREGARGRSGSVGPALTAEGMKEVEDQRDALHKALKLLISRHDRQRREHERAIKKLTASRERQGSSSSSSTQQQSSRTSPYHREVGFLKEEVATLRKRTEDALEQKYQYEKSLSGVKMDLDRADQETRGLRTLLMQSDILAPSSPLATKTGFLEPSSSSSDEEITGDHLALIISTAESERDAAQQSAAQFRQQASQNPSSSSVLLSSADKLEELAAELEEQISSNSSLRERFSSALAQSEAEQRSSGEKLESMQKRLAGLEDSVVAAQQHSELSLGIHEADVRRLDENSTGAASALKRLSSGSRGTFSGKQVSPIFTSSKAGKSLSAKKLSESSLLEASRTHMLERKVRELENLLREAETDAREVVQRLHASQGSFAELQVEREGAAARMVGLRGRVEGVRREAGAAAS